MTIHYYPLRPYSDESLRCIVCAHVHTSRACPIDPDEIATEQTILFGAPNEEESKDALDQATEDLDALDLASNMDLDVALERVCAGCDCYETNCVCDPCACPDCNRYPCRC